MVKKILLALLVVMTACATVMPNSTMVISAVENEYEIYPTPHEVVYQSGDYIIHSQVNVVYDSTIDEVTKKRLNDVMDIKNKSITISDQKQEGVTNIFIGTYGSGEYVDKYVNANYDLDKNVFEKFGSHYLISNNNELCILGTDTDGAFYGITTLKHIFNQMEGSTIRNFVIKDYADAETRGFIEGYYGIPWSNENRMSLMQFGGDFKMTSYVFAPKDDPYHKELWRESYPEDKINEIAKMVQVGNESKCRFVWTAHPFMGGFNSNDVDGEIAALLNKFEQLYDIGVRQFGVLGDDVGSLDRQIVIRMMEAVSTWGKEKGDIYNPVFCPAGYNHAWQDGDTGKKYSELSDYDIGFPDDVQIFWTGEAVCQPVEQKTLDHFRNYNLPEGANQRRSPLFWLNWPVNDINGGRLMMGKGSLLHTDININDIKGIVTNPMQEAQASKVALFAVADYAWNVKAFDDDQSWLDSFKYIDADASEELHTLAKHMSNPEPNGHGLVLKESEELQPLINEFKTKLNNSESINEVGAQLIKEMDVIIAACDGIHTNSKNEILKKELLPFTNSLKDLTTAIRGFIEAKIAIDKKDMAKAYSYYADASAEFINSKNSVRQQIDNTIMVSPGSTHLIPLAQLLQEKLSGPINDYLAGGGEEPLVISASSSFPSFYEGTKIENIADGNKDTAAWHNGYEAAGQYFQVDFNKPTTIFGVHVLNGTTEKPQDTFGYAKLQYSTNGTDFIDLNKDVYGEYLTNVDVTNIEVENVVAVRYVCTQTGSGNKWPAMREFSVAIQPEQQEEEFTKEVIYTPDGWSASNTSAIVDGNQSTSVHFNVRQSGYPDAVNTMIVGDYIGVKLSKPITLGKIDILQGRSDDDGDYMQHAQLQYSVDGENYINVGNVIENTRNIVVDLSSENITAQYVRIVNMQRQNTWYGIREFNVSAKVYHNGKVFTNVGAYKSLTADYFDDNANITPVNAIELAKGEYVGLKLDRIHELSNIESDLTSKEVTIQVSKNSYEWENVTAGDISKDARYIRIINNTNDKVTLDINKFVVNTVEVNPKSLYDSSFSASYPLNVFDGDWTTQTEYVGSQHEGMYFIYDLGQEIDMESLKVVCRDSEWDYPRHAKFFVSTDSKNWTDIMTLGNQDEVNPGETENADEIGFVLPNHEISYNTKKVENLNIKARYLKFEITKTKAGADKWVRLQELEINDGKFMPSENNPTYSGTAKETRKGLYKYMSDKDISTMFVPSNENAFITYSVSDGTAKNAVKVIQNSKNLSNATVQVRTLDKPNEYLSIGTLSQAINEFILAEDTNILDVKISWSDNIPDIVELSVNKKEAKTVDKTILKTLLDDKVVTNTWIADSKKAYDSAYTIAKEIFDNEYVSQEIVDNAIINLQEALNNKKIKGDPTELIKLVESAITNDSDYTAFSWKAYQKAVNAAVNALKNKDNLTADDIEKLCNDIKDREDALIYNPSAFEDASILSDSIQAFINAIDNPESIYTESSFNALKDEQAKMQALLTLQETTKQHPSVFVDATKALNAAKEALVLVYDLPSLVKEYEKLDKGIYTENSWKKYEEAILAGKDEIVDGNKESIQKAIKDINKAKEKLVAKSTYEAVLKLLETVENKDAANYTAKSYQSLMDKVEEIKKIDLAEADNETLSTISNDIQKAMNDLVSIEALKDVIEIIESYDANDYLASSYEELLEVVASSKLLFEDGDKQQIQDAINSIANAIDNLKRKVDKEMAKEYIESIKLEDLSLYTKDSATKYLDAYNVLKGMLNNLDEVSDDEFYKAKNNLEDATKQLVLLTVADPDKPSDSTDPETGDTTNALGLSMMLIVSIACILFVRRKNEEIE